jgi:hypothetical protein
MSIELDANGSFQGSTFHMTAQFSNMKSFGYADFSLINWKSSCFFNYAEFNDRSTFSSSVFMHWADFIKVKFNSSEMSNCRFFGTVNFQDATVEKQMPMENNFYVGEVPDIEFNNNY